MTSRSRGEGINQSVMVYTNIGNLWSILRHGKEKGQKFKKYSDVALFVISP